METPVKKFEVGKMYRFVGSRDEDWDWTDEMEAVCDGKLRKCLWVDEDEQWRAKFEDVEESEDEDDRRGWYWGDGRGEWREVSMEAMSREKIVFKPGMTIVAYVKEALSKTKDKQRKKLLKAFQQCVLSPEVRKQVEQAIVVVLRRDVFELWGLNDHFEKGITNAILLYGGPGVGKTMVSESIAAVVGKNLMVISTADLQSNIPGQMERNVMKAFDDAKRADAAIMFDECDSILADRNNVGTIMASEINSLLTAIERFEGIVILTTNRLHALDPALQRRIIAKVEVKPPTKEARLQIWKNLMPPKMPKGKDVDIERLAKAELTGGEIKNAILLAARSAIAENKNAVEMKDFEESVFSVLKSKQDFAATRPVDISAERVDKVRSAQ
jgi:SpoVK/Ycf46/Vps4 family AAA+-type ATPase